MSPLGHEICNQGAYTIDYHHDQMQKQTLCSHPVDRYMPGATLAIAIPLSQWQCGDVFRGQVLK